MDTKYYINLFQRSADHLDPALLFKHRMDCKAGIWLRSVALKMQKRTWTNRPLETPSFEDSIFCAIWVNAGSIAKNRVHYNIHALKLRELKGYSIKSRDFAEAFRSAFKPFSKKWPNISTDLGPLTLMEGWFPLDPGTLEERVNVFANQFLEIDHIIDELLAARKRTPR